jgi:hypothetical protein
MYEDAIEEALGAAGFSMNQIQKLKARSGMKPGGKMIDTAGKLQVSGDRKQSLIDLKIKRYADAGIVTSQSFLRAELPLTGASNNLPFNLLSNGNPLVNGESIPTQNLLAQNDSFTVTGIALYIKTAVTVDATTQPTPEEHAKAILRTFPNPQVFSVAGEADRLQAIYNGKILIKLDTTDFVPSLPALAMYRVGQSQQGVGGATGVIAVQRDEWAAQFYGKIDAQPSFEFCGQTQLSVFESLNASVNLASGIATRRNYAVLIFTGLLHSGATPEFQRLQSLAQAKK